MIHLASTSRSISRQRAPRSGAALIEFALTVPFLVMMAMGVVDFSRYLDRWNVAETAARDGCRYCATITNNTSGGPATKTDIEDTAALQTENVLADVGIACIDGCVVTANVDSNVDLGNILTVAVTLPFDSMFGDLGLPPARGTFTMRTLAQGL
jgi:Flp pilus assembly protein TadG